MRQIYTSRCYILHQVRGIRINMRKAIVIYDHVIETVNDIGRPKEGVTILNLPLNNTRQRKSKFRSSNRYFKYLLKEF